MRNNVIFNQPFYIIAEGGTTHGGDLSSASKLIAQLSENEIGFIKFQYVIANEIVHPCVGEIDLPGGKTSIYKAFQSVEQPLTFYESLKKKCEDYNVVFLCSAFGKESQRNLNKLSLPFSKIASPELNFYPLWDEVPTENVAIFSTGVSTLEDVEDAVRYAKNNGHNELVGLHCVTHYPAEESTLNLLAIPFLEKKFNIPFGFSDHSTDPYFAPLCAATLHFLTSSFPFFLEKHVTLSRTGSGLDDPFALTPKEMGELSNKMMNLYNNLQSKGKILKKGENGVAFDEEELISLIAQFTGYNKERIAVVLGKQAKCLTDFEKIIYHTTNRSLIALRDIKKGEVVSHENAAFLRAERNHTAGLTPNEILKKFKVLWPRATACEDYNAGDGVFYT